MKTMDKWIFLGAIAAFSWALGHSAGWLHGANSFVLLVLVIWLVFEVADAGARRQLQKLDVIRHKQQH